MGPICARGSTVNQDILMKEGKQSVMVGEYTVSMFFMLHIFQVNRFQCFTTFFSMNWSYEINIKNMISNGMIIKLGLRRRFSCYPCTHVTLTVFNVSYHFSPWIGHSMKHTSKEKRSLTIIVLLRWHTMVVMSFLIIVHQARRFCFLTNLWKMRVRASLE